MTIDHDLELEQLQAEMIAKSDALAPKMIYLQRSYDDLDDPRFNWPEETTWCIDQINTSDVEYIRADLVGVTKGRQQFTENQKLAYISHYGELEQENGRLRERVAALEALADSVGILCEEMYGAEHLQPFPVDMIPETAQQKMNAVLEAWGDVNELGALLATAEGGE